MSTYLFYKKIINHGGAENLLLNHYKSLIKDGEKVKIITFKNKLFENSHFETSIIDVNNIIGLFLFLIKNNNKNKTIICHSGYIDIFFISLFFKINYSVFLHQPTLLSFNESDKYAFKNLEKLKAEKKLNLFSENIKIFKRLKEGMTFYQKQYCNYRFLLSRLALKKAKNTFVLSETSREEKKTLYGINSRVLKGAINNKDILKYKKSLSNKNDNMYFCIVARLDINKRIKKFIRSISSSKNKDKLYLDIYGKGPQLNDIKKTINILKLNNNIKCKGFLPEDEKLNVINKYDFFVCIDMADFRISAYESLKARTPVILTAETYPDKDFKDLNCFFYCRPNNKDILQIINKLYVNKNLKSINWNLVEKKLLKVEWNNYFKEINSHVL